MSIRNSLVMALLVALTIGVALSTQMTAQNPTAGSSEAIHGLLKERRETLNQRVEVLKAQFRNGLAGGTVDTLTSARDELLKADLALATTKQQRVEILKQRVKNFQELEEYAQERKNAAKGTETEILISKAARIQAQIDLVREEET